jgi:hypothetical protein
MILRKMLLCANLRKFVELGGKKRVGGDRRGDTVEWLPTMDSYWELEEEEEEDLIKSLDFL